MRVADRIDIGRLRKSRRGWPSPDAADASHAFAGRSTNTKSFEPRLRKRDPCSLDPEPAAGRVANSEMALGHVGVTLHVQNPIGQRPQSKMA